jgi:hypothetical protein
MGMIKLLFKKKINNKLKHNFKIRDSYFFSFEKKYFKLSKPFVSYNDLHLFCEKSDFNNVVVGSDQLWLPVNIVADYYTLNFVPGNINKISYATSFGFSTIPDKLKDKYTDFLKRINNISVREESGKEIVESLIDKKCNVVCDPALLLTPMQWGELITKHPIIADKYIFCYFLGASKKHRIFAEKIKKITGYKIVSINHCDEFVKYSDKFADIIPYDVGPTEWVNLLMNAEFVCTDSFHGTLFSLMFNKTFYSFRRYPNKTTFSTNTRLDTILSIVGLHDRIFTGDESEIKLSKILDNKIDYDIVNKKLNEYRATSQKFLLDSIK